MLTLFRQETTALLAAYRRRRRHDAGTFERRLAKAEKEIENLITAIKAGILTPSTKAELEQAETERARLLATLKTDTREIKKVTELLPHA